MPRPSIAHYQNGNTSQYYEPPRVDNIPVIYKEEKAESEEMTRDQPTALPATSRIPAFLLPHYRIDEIDLSQNVRPAPVVESDMSQSDKPPSTVKCDIMRQDAKPSHILKNDPSQNVKPPPTVQSDTIQLEKPPVMKSEQQRHEEQGVELIGDLMQFSDDERAESSISLKEVGCWIILYTLSERSL